MNDIVAEWIWWHCLCYSGGSDFGVSLAVVDGVTLASFVVLWWQCF